MVRYFFINAGWEPEAMFTFVGQVDDAMLRVVRNPGCVLCVPQDEVCFELSEQLRKPAVARVIGSMSLEEHVPAEPARDGFIRRAERIGSHAAYQIMELAFWRRKIREHRGKALLKASAKVWYRRMILRDHAMEGARVGILNLEGHARSPEQGMELDELRPLRESCVARLGSRFDDRFADEAEERYRCADDCSTKPFGYLRQICHSPPDEDYTTAELGGFRITGCFHDVRSAT
jgi:hypothetical protein